MDLQNKLLEGVEAILGENGLAAGTGQFRFNAQQYDYARRAAIGYCRFDKANGKAAINMLQASTGLGKTLGYLVPAMLYAAYTGKRIGVSTFTRHLQAQILGKDAKVAAAWVAQVTGVKLSIARRLGRGNYVSALGCARLHDQLTQEDRGRSNATAQLVEELQEWAERDDTSGVLDDFLEARALDALPEGINRELVCLDLDSPDFDAEKFENDVALSKAADVLIVNHALMVVHVYRWASVLDGVDSRKLSLVIFDEADRLADAAAAILTSSVPLHKSQQVVDKAAAAFGLTGIGDALVKLKDLVMSQHVPASRVAVVRDSDTMGLLLAKTAVGLQKAARLMKKEGDLLSDRIDPKKAQIIADFLDTTNDIVRVSDALKSQDGSALVSWSPVKAYPSLLVGNPEAGRIMNRLWSLQNNDEDEETDGEILPPHSPLEAVLFTSATLATPGRRLPEAFDDFSKTIGVIRHPKRVESTGKSEVPAADQAPIHNVQVDLFSTYQPGRFGMLHFVLADPGIPNPSVVEPGEEGDSARSNPDWLDYCATMIRAASAAGGRTLVLTLSWQDTLALEQRLQDIPSLLVHRRGEPLANMLGQYRGPGNENAVLLSPGAWEGVDLPGMVNQLVVTRIPFLPPDRPEANRLYLHLTMRGYDKTSALRAVKSRDVANTRRKLEQGIGRAIRSRDDVATVWIADPRFPAPDAFADSLDPVLMAAPARRVNLSLRSCIPQRFLSTTYEKATVCLPDGTQHAVI